MFVNTNYFVSLCHCRTQKYQRNMKKQEKTQKKRYGDAARIAQIANVIRAKKGLKPYSERTIRAMLSGERTMKEDVQEASNGFYNAINNLQATAV